MENTKKETDLEILFAAGAAGIAGELLIVDAGWGLGASLWVVGLSTVGLTLKGNWKASQNTFTQFLFIPLFVLAICLGWRDALFLKIATVIGLITALGLVIQSTQTLFLPKGVHVPGLFTSGLRSFFGFTRYLKSDVDWSSMNSYVDKSTTTSVLRGVFIALPFLLVFGVLLASADENFGMLLGGMIDINLTKLPGQLISVVFFAFVAGVFLYGSLHKLKARKQSGSKSQAGLSMLEAGIVLGLINLMFATFVLMQMGYLFGGVHYIEHVADISLKQYTRRGFFELVTVAAIALPLLMGLLRFFKPERREHILQFNMLAGLQIALLLIMLISAAQRMMLYTSAYGITELRLYSSVFMIWIAFVLGWFGWTALRGYALEFVRGSAMVGVLMVIGLNVMNPDGVIVQSNLNRAIGGKTYDEDSLKDLSADAIPIAIKALPLLHGKERHMVFTSVNTYRKEQGVEGWRDWTYSKHVADVEVKTMLINIQGRVPDN
ncbi:MAG: DUF4173 domain-containing protein [Rhodothermaceae bacterium]|nr:DUF4173 domain-containing protein [Rhodothermaceae bacterium]